TKSASRVRPVYFSSDITLEAIMAMEKCTYWQNT
ncbi:MAG: hypothetical protein ACI9DQ_001833, partial [Glaciecola sp.]